MSGLGYPMPDYIAAWKVYRTLSNEDSKTASELAGIIKEVMDSRNLKLLDVGPGDGRVLLRLLLRLAHKPVQLTYVEPNPDFVKETSGAIGFHEFAGSVHPLKEKLKDVPQAQIQSHDVILCSHTAYFLTPDEMATLVEAVRKGATLIVVLDDEKSIFSQLWEKTSPAFLRNATGHIRTIKTLREEGFIVHKSEIQAELSDPRGLRPEMRDLVLSMLCYSDYTSWEEQISDWALEMVSRHIVDGRLRCVSNCFTISYPQT